MVLLIAASCEADVSSDGLIPDSGPLTSEQSVDAGPTADAAGSTTDAGDTEDGPDGGPIVDKLVVWQHNISWFSSAGNAEKAILHSIEDYGRDPDIFMFQECGPKCICGESGEYNTATGKCDTVSGAGVARALQKKGLLDKYQFRKNRGRVIGFRNDRFNQIGKDYRWGAKATNDDPNFAYCPTIKVGDQIAVMLRDKWSVPQRQILVSTGHWFVGRDCACKQVDLFEQNWKTVDNLHNATGENAIDYVDLHLMSGDWNAEPGTALPAAYREASRTCDGLKLGGKSHSDTGGTTWTFCQGTGGVSNPTGCYNKKKVDYLWARNYNGSDITWQGGPDTSANYFNDHRAIRTVFTY